MHSQRLGWIGILTQLAFLSRLFAGQIIPIQEVFEPPGPWDPSKFAKVAVLQWNQSQPTPVGVTAAQAESFKQRNREIIASYVRQAVQSGAKMVITPEFSVTGYPYHPSLPPEQDNFLNREEVAPYVETIPGPTTDFFSKLTKELGIYLHVGFAEVDGKTGVYYNTVVALGPDGKILAKYRKIHLYQVETAFLSPGSGGATYENEFGKVGFIICSDVYSNDPMDEYKREGVNVLALSTSWAQMNSGMSAFEGGARWVNAYLMAANQTYFPDSGVINPNGTDQSHIRQSNGLAFGYLPFVSRPKSR